MDEIIKELNDEIDRLLARLTMAWADRDSARRELCDMLARERSDENFHAVVKARGWDYLIEEQDR